jgi:transcriptional regulator with XRE-family HTH domain
MAVMTEDRTKLRWDSLAAAIRATREDLGLTQEALAARAGVAEGSVQNLESGKPRNRMPQTLAKIEPHLGWAEGSGRLILEGGQPIPADPADIDDGEPDSEKLRRKYPLRIVGELESDDPLLDSTVIELPGTNGARMTVVVHGVPDATPQQIQDALIAWRKAEQELRRLPDGGEDGAGPRAANGT